MKEEGPQLSILLSRLAETPEIFLSNPVSSEKREAGVDAAAVIADLVRDIGGSFPEEKELAQFVPLGTKENRNWLGMVLIISHLLHDGFFLGHSGIANEVIGFISGARIKELSRLVDFREIVTNQEKREEIARLTLDALGFFPAGESERLGADRLKTLDSVERERIIKKSAEAQERAKKLREEMARREAEEAASKMSRE